MRLLKLTGLTLLIAWMAWMTWRQERAISLIERTCNVVASVNVNLATATGNKSAVRTDWQTGCPWVGFAYRDDVKPR